MRRLTQNTFSVERTRNPPRPLICWWDYENIFMFRFVPQDCSTDPPLPRRGTFRGTWKRASATYHPPQSKETPWIGETKQRVWQ